MSRAERRSERRPSPAATAADRTTRRLLTGFFSLTVIGLLIAGVMPPPNLPSNEPVLPAEIVTVLRDSGSRVEPRLIPGQLASTDRYIALATSKFPGGSVTAIYRFRMTPPGGKPLEVVGLELRGDPSASIPSGRGFFIVDVATRQAVAFSRLSPLPGVTPYGETPAPTATPSASPAATPTPSASPS